MEESKNNISDIIKNIKQYGKYDSSLIDKLLYLIEWKYILVTGKRLFEFRWYHSTFGIEVLGKYEIIHNDSYSTTYNLRKRQVVKFIMEKVERLQYTGIVHLANNTFPLASSKTYDELNLVELSNEYKDDLSTDEYRKVTSLNIKKLSLLDKIKRWFNEN